MNNTGIPMGHKRPIKHLLGQWDGQYTGKYICMTNLGLIYLLPLNFRGG